MFGRLIKRKPAFILPEGQSAQRKTMEPSVIASNMNILGNIISDGILDIDGQVDGNVTGHTVTIRPNGRIRGDVVAEHIYVHGIVDGLIKALNVTLYDTAKVHGTVMHESLTVEDGATIDGKLKRMERSRSEQPQAVADAESVANASSPTMETDAPTLGIESLFDNDNDTPQSEAESRILDNLRLIS